MKRFLISFVVGITCIAIGCTMLFFEFSEYTTQSACTLFYNQQNVSVNTFDVSSHNLDVYFEGRYISYEIEIDESMKDTIKITSADYVEHSVSGNEYRAEGISNRKYERSTKWNDITKAMDVFIEGLKERKLYTCDEEVAVKITCSSASRKKLNLHVNEHQ